MPIIKRQQTVRFDLDNLPKSKPYKSEPKVEIKPLDENQAKEKAEVWKLDDFKNCEVNSEKVIKVLTGFVMA